MAAVINAVVIAFCSFIGMRLKQGIPKQVNERIMEAIGLAIIAIGIAGAVRGEDTIVFILSVVMGTFVGETIDIDAHVKKGIITIQSRVHRLSQDETFIQGFISGTLFFCVGSMAIFGALESGLTGNNTTLYIKALIDGITAVLLASSFGIGVAASSLPVLALEGGIILLSGLLSPLLGNHVILEIVSVGSTLLIGLGLNMLKITDLKILNFTPSLFMPMIIYPIISLF
ncbi:DUF554 domain-containing protein [Allofustis seminis]|uniref:DUF554 domain-containing protein n=1 Tax=Allofustis seminis TaxID=166939 RepID=UPI00036C5460|nr:DUF554 domain-containing protein [Allofustis seminis]